MPVAESLQSLQVTLYYVGWSTVLRVVDGNNVPYSNLTLQVTSETGQVRPLDRWITNEFGFLYLDYRPNSPTGPQTLTAELAGAPETRRTFNLSTAP